MMTCHVVTKEEQPSPRYMRQEFRAVKWSTQQANRCHPVVIFWAMSPAGTVQQSRHEPV